MKLNEASVQHYKEELTRFNSEYPEAQELLAKARYIICKRYMHV